MCQRKLPVCFRRFSCCLRAVGFLWIAAQMFRNGVQGIQVCLRSKKQTNNYFPRTPECKFTLSGPPDSAEFWSFWSSRRFSSTTGHWRRNRHNVYVLLRVFGDLNTGQTFPVAWVSADRLTTVVAAIVDARGITISHVEITWYYN